MSYALPRNYAWIGAASVGLAALADALFYGHPWGVNAAVFAAAVVIAVVLRSPGLWRSRLGRYWVVLAGMVLLALVEEPSPLAVLMAIATVGTLVLAAQGGLGGEVRAWMVQWLHLLGTLFLRLIFDNFIMTRWIGRHPRAGRKLMTAATLVAWWVIPLLAGSIFVALFAIANPIIEEWVRWAINGVWTVFDWLPLFLQADRLLLWILVAVGAYGLLRYRGLRRREAVRVPPVAAAGGGRNWGAGIIVRCLVVFNGVFLVQSLLDCVYLFGGRALPAGMTYKEYAHRGAYPLVATALLTALFVLLTFRTGGAAQRSAWARRLVYAWIAQNIFLMFSTIWRLFLYVDVGGLTRLRVATMIWLLLVALGFCWVILKIARGLSNGWLCSVNVVTTFSVLFVCAFINFDGLIANYNVRHCVEVTGEGRTIDLNYLEHLGPDSLPALAVLRQADTADRARIDGMMQAMREELASELKEWRGWTYRRWREAPEMVRHPAVAAGG